MTALICETAEKLRATIERAREADVEIPWLKRFPKNCCNFTSNLLLMDLSDVGVSSLRRMMGGVPEEGGDDTVPHVWVQADGFVTDITADYHGQASVIVEGDSAWHQSLEDVRAFVPRLDVPEGIAAEEITRLRELYQDVLQKLEAFRDDA
ncbi:MAG: hypothetical protein ABJZ55_11730 [Fuerstiella sp.]